MATPAIPRPTPLKKPAVPSFFAPCRGCVTKPVMPSSMPCPNSLPAVRKPDPMSVTRSTCRGSSPYTRGRLWKPLDMAMVNSMGLRRPAPMMRLMPLLVPYNVSRVYSLPFSSGMCDEIDCDALRYLEEKESLRCRLGLSGSPLRLTLRDRNLLGHAEVSLRACRASAIDDGR